MTPEEFAAKDHEAYRKRTHEGKNPYSHDGAKRAAKGSSARFGGRVKVAYRCDFCEWYHVGSRKGPRK
jgi:hypothetical protein